MKNTNRSRTSKPRLRRVALVFAALLLLSVGGGIGTASLTDLEGTFHVQIRPSIEGFLVCGPVGGPFMPGPCIALEPYTAHFLIGDAVDPNGGDLSFEWDLSFDSYDFIPEVTGIGPVSVTLEDGPALQFIAVRVTSTSGAQGLIWTYFEVQNVPPVADPGGPYTVDSDTPITFSGSATDPSTADTTAGFFYFWDIDYDGVIFDEDYSGLALNDPTHTYTLPGVYTVGVAAGDIDGDIGPVAITTVTVNGPPVALDQSIVTDEDVPLGVTLTAIDIDPLTYTVVAGPAQGTLSGTAPDLTYTPNLDYSGPDSFTFKANDGTSNSNVATVSITVVPAPIFYLHNNPTPPIGGTSSQVGLPFNASVPTASTLYNYDTDRDVAAGLIIQKGGSGASEADPVKYQNWITEPLAEDLTLSGDLEVSFWSAMKDFAGSKLGEVTVYVRDYDGSGYFLIGTGTLDQVDWQGGSASFVQNTMIITGIDYTVSAGHRLEIKFIVGLDSEDDMFFAYDTTTYSSYLTVGP